MSWDEPTQEDLDDAIIEDTVHCARCGASYVLPEGYLFGERSICVECTQDEIDDLMRLVAAAEVGLDVDWLASRLLEVTARAGYLQATATARADYDQARATARTEYKQVMATVRADYDRIEATARAGYLQATATARADYDQARATALIGALWPDHGDRDESRPAAGNPGGITPRADRC